MKEDIDLDNVRQKALRAKTMQYMERLNGLRAKARELLADSGLQFLDEVFREGTTGVRSVSRVVKDKERKAEVTRICESGCRLCFCTDTSTKTKVETSCIAKRNGKFRGVCQGCGPKVQSEVRYGTGFAIRSHGGNDGVVVDPEGQMIRSGATVLHCTICDHWA